MSTKEILAAVANGQVSPDEAAKLIAASNGKSPAKITMKVSEKGALSVYGLGRFPTTLYVEQWERLLAPEQVKAMQDFIKANAASLTRKNGD